MASEHGSDSEEILESKNTSKPETNNTTKNRQTYNINNSDNSRTPLVTAVLNGENYRTWSRSIKMALHAKTKLGADRKRGDEYHSRLNCDHCGKIGYVKEKCFEIVRYPASWESRRTQRREPNKPRGHQVENLAQAT
ncbi:unnamed protein product [Vicia faba]|uniref:Retrotransposon Copia-like N-terminal domain-containing protein n=1 Tax=Vicia faba TaxID=3906 RepID=A0AAV1A2J0_VICFA|nr:unnamed protein product [Vicia faba]